LRIDAFEGRYFERTKPSKITVEDAWTAYKPISERDNDTWLSERGRASHLLRHLGKKLAASLTVKEVDEYRTKRLGETTRRKSAPAPATLDKEVELLKRILNYAVACGDLKSNPVADVKLLRKPNVRRSVLDEAAFEKVLAKAEPHVKPILLVAFDTGMRRSEVVGLKWSQVDLKAGVVKLAAEETKTEEPRTIFLTSRVREALSSMPRYLKSEWVFTNPETNKAWNDVRKMFRRAADAAGFPGLWFHDLRRSFVTNARRHGVPESVVMKMSGHKTRSVFERYNIIEEEDLIEAVKRLESGRASGLGQDLAKMPENAQNDQRPHRQKNQ
ncbi:MAG TPA: site-specific integrase, partial [Myxococcales bacterium]|nr:site-specific integrase [Myxococcales bacterium]